MSKTSSEHLSVSEADSSITLGNLKLKLRKESPFVPNEDYRIIPITFLDNSDEQVREMNGCVFEIKPGKSTRIMQITEPGFVSLRVVIKGSGHYLGVEANGAFDDPVTAEDGVTYELVSGMVDCWVAGKEGMMVLDISTPPYDPKFETEVPIDDPRLPKEFFEDYSQLRA